jgi:excisionase family DNA binding protein
MDEPMMTVEQLAEVLQVSTKTIYRLLKRGEIPALRIGHHWRFDRKDVSRWLFERRVERLRDTA